MVPQPTHYAMGIVVDLQVHTHTQTHNYICICKFVNLICVYMNKISTVPKNPSQEICSRIEVFLFSRFSDFPVLWHIQITLILLSDLWNPCCEILDTIEKKKKTEFLLLQQRQENTEFWKLWVSQTSSKSEYKSS